MPWEDLPELSKKEVSDFDRRERRKTRFVVDESLPEEIADILRKLGWNALSAKEAHLTGYSDESVVAYSVKERRVLITNDRDFLDDRKHPFTKIFAIIRLPGIVGEPGGHRKILRALWFLHTFFAPWADVLRGSKVELQENGEVRLRSWRSGDSTIDDRRYRFHEGRSQLWK